MFRSLLIVSWLLWPTPNLFAADIEFESQIEPIFKSRCYDCHSSEAMDGGVGLNTFYQFGQPADSGRFLVDYQQPEKSLLLDVLTGANGTVPMPFEEDRLTDEQIELIRQWILQGASRPDDGWRPAKHWAYIVPEMPSLPPVRNSQWPRNEIDHFILATLEDQQLAPNPPAHKLNLLRRLYLDLIGLPPTVNQAEDFLNDSSETALENIVDQLLASPHFGEKWARHWLDLARYADSEGYQRDEMRTLWPYRDWVIDALNDDMPFDEFTIEQLAGDLLPNATLKQKIATGFHRNATLNLEAGTDPAEDHYKQVVDRVNTTGTVWLGTTLACMQCHNHKYDPFSTVEYYQLFSFFNNTPYESRQQGMEMGMSGMVYIGTNVTVPRNADILARRELLATQLQTQTTELKQKVDPLWNEKQQDKEFIQTLTVGQKLRLTKKASSRQLVDYRVAVQKLFPDDAELLKQVRKLEALETELESISDYTTRVMVEMETARETYVARRGEFLDHGIKVEPAVLSGLHDWPQAAPRNRLGLAQWLVDPANPLIGRVTVNRIWAELFGQGIVPTLDDFGIAGEKPTHPELLDWLAVRFIEQDDWSLKAMIRRIVLSATYQQSTDYHESAAAVDPSNQLLWRHPGHRLSAELIRDNALVISGLLNPQLGGPPAYPFQPEGVWRKGAGAGPAVYNVSKGDEQYRRGIYTVWRRSAHYPSFANFDAPDRGACVVQRSRSNTPLQALTLMNDPVYHQAAQAFADRIVSEGGESIKEKLIWAWQTVLTREPTLEERQILKAVYEQQMQTNPSETEAWLTVAMTLLDTHESICRN